LYTIYKGAILPLLLYGAPVWIEALQKECNKKVYKKAQRLINIKKAKAFQTTSNEALCTLTGLTPIVIKKDEAAKLYSIMRKSQVQGTDYEVQPNDWLHPANTIRISEQHEQQEQQAIQIFTDGSKSEHVVGAGIAIFVQGKLEHQLRYTLHNKCSNNQTEQLAIVKALEIIEKSYINGCIPRTATVHTDSRITLQSLKNTKNHNYLIEEIRKKAIALENRKWTITFTWIKSQAGIYGKELADKLAKEAARNDDISFDRIPRREIVQQVRDQSTTNWQNQWDRTIKGLTTK
jgi:ribonuclease HI